MKFSTTLTTLACVVVFSASVNADASNNVDCDAVFGANAQDRLKQMYLVAPMTLTVDETGYSATPVCADPVGCDGSPTGCGVNTYYDKTLAFDIVGAPFQLEVSTLMRAAVWKNVGPTAFATEDQQWQFDACLGGNVWSPVARHGISVYGNAKDTARLTDYDRGCIWEGPPFPFGFSGQCQPNPGATQAGDGLRLRFAQNIGVPGGTPVDTRIGSSGHPLMDFDWVSAPVFGEGNQDDEFFFAKFTQDTNTPGPNGYDRTPGIQRGSLPVGDLSTGGYMRLQPVRHYADPSDEHDYNLCVTAGDQSTAEPSPKGHCGHPGTSFTMEVCGSAPDRQLWAFNNNYEDSGLTFPYPLRHFSY